MRLKPLSLAIMAAGGLQLGCVATRPTVYQSWGQQLGELPFRAARIDDVSFILGTTPEKCEAVTIGQPLIGVTWDANSPVVARFVLPNGPAEQVGIRAGDVLTAIGGKQVSDGESAWSAYASTAREGRPLQVETSRGAVTIVPKVLKAEQCYWDVRAGEVAQTRGGAYVNAWGGAARSSGEAYERFFRATCRVVEGFVWECSSNWQG
jgi:hypothetical protein